MDSKRLFKSFPALPTKGFCNLSSVLPGASPTIIIFASLLPSENTKFFPGKFLLNFNIKFFNLDNSLSLSIKIF